MPLIWSSPAALSAMLWRRWGLPVVSAPVAASRSGGAGLKPGTTAQESAELAPARARIGDLEEEVKILRKAAAAVEAVVRPKDRYRLVAELHAEGVWTGRACHAQGLSRSGYYAWAGRAPSPRVIRQAWLTDLIGTIHQASRSTYGAPRVHADPHSFGIPRLDGAVKAALVEIQSDEYGGGRPGRMHAELFRSTMRWFGLNDEYGHYVSAVPPATLAVSSLMFGVRPEPPLGRSALGSLGSSRDDLGRPQPSVCSCNTATRRRP